MPQAIIIIKTSDKEMYQYLSKKPPQKNYKGSFGNYCCIPGCQSAFYDANRVKAGILLFKLPKDPALRKKGCKLLKDIDVLEELIKFSKMKKVMVCEFHFNPKQIRASLGIGRKTYLPGSVSSVFEFKPEEKKKERKPPKPYNNQETSSEFAADSESSDSQCFGDASNSVVEFPEDKVKASKLLAENEKLRCKTEHWEIENKKLKEENIKLKSHIYNFDNISESRDEFRAATGLTVESFNNLLEFLNPGKDSCNIKFYDTSSRLSQSCDDIGSPKSGPKPKLSSEDQLFTYMTWLKKWICSFTFSSSLKNF